MADIIIDRERCVGCGQCVLDCFRGLLAVEDGKARVREGACIACGHCVAVCPANAVRLAGCPEAEIRPYDPDTFDIPAERLLNFMEFRRSVRRFQARPVEEEKLSLLLEAARYAPTGGNRQENRYILLDRKKGEIIDLAVNALFAATERMETDPSLQGARPYRDKWRAIHSMWKEEGRDGLFYGAPCVLLVVACHPEGNSGMLDGGLASDHVELMAHALGLGVCYVGFFTRAAALEPELYRRLGVEEWERVVSAMAIGYPDVTYHRTVNRRGVRLARL